MLAEVALADEALATVLEYTMHHKMPSSTSWFTSFPEFTTWSKSNNPSVLFYMTSDRANRLYLLHQLTSEMSIDSTSRIISSVGSVQKSVPRIIRSLLAQLLATKDPSLTIMHRMILNQWSRAWRQTTDELHKLAKVSIIDLMRLFKDDMQHDSAWKLLRLT